MSDNRAFMDLVELHERMWGQDQYPNRPTLTELLTAKIVAVWSGKSEVVLDAQTGYRRQPAETKDRSFLLTCHHSAAEFNQVLSDLLLLLRVTPYANRKLSKLFVHQQPVEIAGVRLVIKQDKA